MKIADIIPGAEIAYQESWWGAPLCKARVIEIIPGGVTFSGRKHSASVRAKVWRKGVWRKGATPTVYDHASPRHLRQMTWDEVDAEWAAIDAATALNAQRKADADARWKAAAAAARALSITPDPSWDPGYSAGRSVRSIEIDTLEELLRLAEES